eukprot:TRINITY_DN5142_c0_g1_i4.p1 TRINITY_DN5142_c0_g1~~TRINITY_DN5142_c0_g1_i4.p1  ORF type:complete len:759 (+),score=271.86 TRINITY_DN5142_c0_g1_i4:112-2388(+)
MAWGRNPVAEAGWRYWAAGVFSGIVAAAVTFGFVCLTLPGNVSASQALLLVGPVNLVLTVSTTVALERFPFARPRGRDGAPLTHPWDRPVRSGFFGSGTALYMRSFHQTSRFPRALLLIVETVVPYFMLLVAAFAVGASGDFHETLSRTHVALCVAGCNFVFVQALLPLTHLAVMRRDYLRSWHMERGGCLRPPRALMDQIRGKVNVPQNECVTSLGCGSFSCLYAGVLLIVVSIASVFVVPAVLHAMVESQVVVTSVDDQTYEVFQDPGGVAPVLTSFHAWNITNEAEYLAGGKPRMERVGPFIYRTLVGFKTAIEWNDDKSEVCYQYSTRFQYVPEISQGGDSGIYQRVVIPNYVLFGLAEVLLQQVPPQLAGTALKLVADAARATGDPWIVSTTPFEIIFGRKDPLMAKLVELINAAGAEFGIKVPPITPGSFLDPTKGVQPMGMNSGQPAKKGSDGRTCMDTGKGDARRVGRLTKWAGFAANTPAGLDVWGTPWANMVNGTDGTPFLGAFMKKDEKPYVWIDQLQRSVQLSFVRKEQCRSVDVWRFEYDLSQFRVTPDRTAGFHDTVAGLWNMTAPQHAPVMVSRPFFVDADPAAASTVEMPAMPADVNPITFYQVEPTVGSVLAAHLTQQVNLLVQPARVPGLFAPGARDAFVPILQIDADAALPADQRAQLLMMGGLQKAVQTGLQGLWVVGVVLGLLCGLPMVMRYRQFRNTERTAEALLEEDTDAEGVLSTAPNTPQWSTKHSEVPVIEP